MQWLEARLRHLHGQAVSGPDDLDPSLAQRQPFMSKIAGGHQFCLIELLVGAGGLQTGMGDRGLLQEQPGHGQVAHALEVRRGRNRQPRTRDQEPSSETATFLQ